jgi:hypothetical protein
VRQRQVRKDVLDEAELLDVPGAPELRLRFRGGFEGRAVTWLATLRALAAPDSDGTTGALPASYIEIGEDRPDGVPIEVGLPVAAVDEPTIRKAMIMIRQYRRLRRGRHEYGPTGRDAPRTDP